ncbi:hypothetical protein [Streptomyces sp. NBC_01643]|uniref:hypothetical protein n=1 Tax=Streptomyces sp. NBC_01643 TaxID=2975906 RepID=UPI00386DB913|nr:hypothetical protein OHB03_03360 [Streptomyces sp. NBC_01643]
MRVSAEDGEEFDAWGGATHRSALAPLADLPIDWKRFDGWTVSFGSPLSVTCVRRKGCPAPSVTGAPGTRPHRGQHPAHPYT